MSDIKLSLENSDSDSQNPPPPFPDPPIAGYFAIGLALFGIFTSGVIFVPLAFLASILPI